MATVKCPKCGLRVRAEDGECFACGAILPRIRNEESVYSFDHKSLSGQLPPPARPQPPVVSTETTHNSNSNNANTKFGHNFPTPNGYDNSPRGSIPARANSQEYDDQIYAREELPPLSITPDQTVQPPSAASNISIKHTAPKTDRLKNSTLSVFALIFSIIIFPIGIILGIIDLSQKDKTHTHGLSVAALVIGGLITLFAFSQGGTRSETSEPKDETTISNETTDASTPVDSNSDNASETVTAETVTKPEEPQESVKTEIQTPEAEEDPSTTIEEETPSNDVDAKEWPSVAALDMSNEEMMNLYKEYYDKIYSDEYPLDDPDAIEAYEAKVGQEIADKYGITPDDAFQVYSYVSVNYDKVATNGEGVSQEPKLKFGELLSVVMNGSTAVVSAKITPNLTNEMTINENYINVDELIKKDGYDIFDEIQYYAFSDTIDGDQIKIISFTVPKKTIELSKSDKIMGTMLENYVDDLWISPVLQK